MRKQYVLFDARAMNGNTADAQVLSCADSLSEALLDRQEMYPSAVIAEYDLAEDGKTLKNERILYHAGDAGAGTEHPRTPEEIKRLYEEAKSSGSPMPWLK